MARSIATAENLRVLSGLFNDQNERILSVEKNLSNRLDALQWTDPVGLNFRQRYEELKDNINKTLVPALERYSKYLTEQAIHIDEFNEDLL